jgi:hypothetical protein
MQTKVPYISAVLLCGYRRNWLDFAFYIEGDIFDCEKHVIIPFLSRIRGEFPHASVDLTATKSPYTPEQRNFVADEIVLYKRVK